MNLIPKIPINKQKTLIDIKEENIQPDKTTMQFSLSHSNFDSE
jgi:hypothetical protein